MLTDLAKFDLPILDEPHHPRLQKYEKDHTKAWAKAVDGADAFVFVIPEYNYFAPPAVVNAVDYLAKEWNYKPAAFLSYGGVSGGLRSVQSMKPLLTTVKVMPLPDAIAIPAPVYLDALPVEMDRAPQSEDLAEPPAAPTVLRDSNGRVRPAPLMPTVPVTAVAVLNHADRPRSVGDSVIKQQVEVFLHTDSKAAALVTKMLGDSAPKMAQQGSEQLLTFFSGIARIAHDKPDKAPAVLGDKGR